MLHFAVMLLIPMSLMGVGFSSWLVALENSSLSVGVNVTVAPVIDSTIFTKCENVESFGYGEEGMVVDGVAKLSSANLTYEVGLNAKAANDNGYITNNQFTFNATLSSNNNILADSTYLTSTSVAGEGVSGSSGTITYGTADYSATIPITLTLADTSSTEVIFDLSFTFSGINSTVVTESSLTFNLTLEAVPS